MPHRPDADVPLPSKSVQFFCSEIGDTTQHLRTDVRAVLAAIPADVAAWIIERVQFVLQGDAAASSMILRSNAGSRAVPIVMLYAELSRYPQSVRRYAIAHELAHQWCGHADDHGSPGESDLDRYARVEREANEQAAEWGFPVPTNF